MKYEINFCDKSGADVVVKVSMNVAEWQEYKKLCVINRIEELALKKAEEREKMMACFVGPKGDI